MSLSNHIANTYGSKKGMLRFYKYRLLSMFSSNYRSLLPQRGQVKRLVFICSGNICRSAFGEAVSRKLGFPAVSYGLHCRGGDTANERAMAFAKENGYELENHVTQNINSYEPQSGDLVLFVEPSHYRQAPDCIRESQFIYLGRYTSVRNLYLHDPFSANNSYFVKNMKAIEMGVKEILKEI